MKLPTTLEATLPADVRRDGRYESNNGLTAILNRISDPCRSFLTRVHASFLLLINHLTNRSLKHHLKSCVLIALEVYDGFGAVNLFYKNRAESMVTRVSGPDTESSQRDGDENDPEDGDDRPPGFTGIEGFRKHRENVETNDLPDCEQQDKGSQNKQTRTDGGRSNPLYWFFESLLIPCSILSLLGFSSATVW